MRVRVLDPEEHQRLAGVGHFALSDSGPDPSQSSVVVVEDDAGKIVGYWCAVNIVHLEPLWVEETHRRSGLGLAMWDELSRLLRGLGIPNAFATVADVDATENLPLALELGFVKLPASILYIDVTKNRTKEGE